MKIEQYLENSYIVKHYTIEYYDDYVIVEIDIQTFHSSEDSSELLKLVRNIKSKIDKIYRIDFYFSYSL